MLLMECNSVRLADVQLWQAWLARPLSSHKTYASEQLVINVVIHVTDENDLGLRSLFTSLHKGYNNPE